MNCTPPGSSVHGDSPGKNTGVGCLSILQGIFPTQGSIPGLPHCRWILYHLSHQGNPKKLSKKILETDQTHREVFIQEKLLRDLHGVPVVKILHFHYQWCRFDPWLRELGSHMLCGQEKQQQKLLNLW